MRTKGSGAAAATCAQRTLHRVYYCHLPSAYNSDTAMSRWGALVHRFFAPAPWCAGAPHEICSYTAPPSLDLDGNGDEGADLGRHAAGHFQPCAGLAVAEQAP